MVVFEDLPSTDTPLNASNLNNNFGECATKKVFDDITFNNLQNYGSGLYNVHATGNTPEGTGDYYVMQIAVPSNNYAFQEARKYGGDTVYQRIKLEGTWQSWTILNVNNSTNWNSLNNVIKYKISSNIITIIGESSGAIRVGNGTYTAVGILPSELRPKGVHIPFVAHFKGGTENGQSSFVQSNGNIEIYLPSGVSTDYWAFSVSYPLGE